MSGIQSLSRGLQIVELIWQAGRSMGITELAEHLDIDKSSASRLVKTLVQHGYLQPERGSRRFVVGQRLYQMGWELVNRMPLRETARKYLYRLVKETEECAHTAVYSEGKALMIDDVEAAHSLRVVGGIGRLLPMHCTAVGKTLLAFGDLPLPPTLERKMPKTITDPEALAHHLAGVCELGFAYDDEEHQPGVRCLAAPVYNLAGMAVAAIGISGPTVRVTDERVSLLAGHVIRAARELSAELGYEEESA
ncbi:MAG: IclR family transcriptional regulator [Chloroflexi bacterium]|nr:IclR family transcriptional regulator [Chloroflexota bacterium]